MITQGGDCPGNQGNMGKVKKSEKGLKSQVKVMEFEKKRGKSGNSNSFSEHKISVIPQHQSECQFLPKYISRSQGKIREDKSQ